MGIHLTFSFLAVFYPAFKHTNPEFIQYNEHKRNPHLRVRTRWPQADRLVFVGQHLGFKKSSFTVFHFGYLFNSEYVGESTPLNYNIKWVLQYYLMLRSCLAEGPCVNINLIGSQVF